MPTAQKMPDSGGTTTFGMPSWRARSGACTPPLPPKAISAKSRGSRPRSTVTARTARAIRDLFAEHNTQSQLLKDDSASREILVTEAEASAKDAELKELLPFGFACQ